MSRRCFKIRRCIVSFSVAGCLLIDFLYGSKPFDEELNFSQYFFVKRCTQYKNIATVFAFILGKDPVQISLF